jgi:hypothetical protein
MTAKKDLKRRVHERQSRTGESYTAARAHVVANGGEVLSTAIDVEDAGGTAARPRQHAAADPHGRAHRRDVRVRDARAEYFARNGFSEAAYSDRWVRLPIGPVCVAFPSTASRRRAVPLHDLHHVATGYDTTWVGEAEIGAWEIAGGCGRRYATAWILDCGAFALGLAIAPRRTYRAFVRGRRARTLYRDGWRDELLELSVAELRARICFTDEPPRATWRDRLAFAAWIALLVSPGLGLLATAVAVTESW